MNNSGLKTDDYVSRYDVTETDYSKQKEICTHLDKLYSIIKMCEDELAKLDELIKARFVEMFGDARENPKGFSTVPFIDVVEYMGDIGSNGANKVVAQKALDETQTLFDSLMQEYFG